MKHISKQPFAALLALLVLLSLTACGGGENGELRQSTVPVTTEETVLDGSAETATGNAPDSRQNQTAMALLGPLLETSPQIPLAAAYLGHIRADDPTPLPDWLAQTVPGLLAEMPFLSQIPENRILGNGYGDVYCILPRDETTTVSVNRVRWVPQGNGVLPEVVEVLYRDEYAEPLLVFVCYEGFGVEPDIGICAVAGNGAQVEWYPTRLEECGSVIVPYGENCAPLVLDFTGFGDISAIDPGYEPGYGADDWWLPPTDEGLADTIWVCDRWSIELYRGDGEADYAGTAQLYYQFADYQEFQLLYSGLWRMEGDCLRLEITDGTGTSASGSYPVLIDPSGEHLYIQQSRDGGCPPFFEEDMFSMELVLSYG